MWEWRGGALSTVIGSSESMLFAGPGGSFSTPLTVGDSLGQEGTHVSNTVLGTSGGELPNCQFANNAQVAVGGSTISVNSATPSQCTLRVRLVLASASAATGSFFDAYGTTALNSPADGDVRVYGFEQSNSSWLELDYPNSKRLSLAAQTVVSMTHDWYIGLSVRALAEGVFDDLTFRLVTEYSS